MRVFMQLVAISQTWQANIAGGYQLYCGQHVCFTVKDVPTYAEALVLIQNEPQAMQVTSRQILRAVVSGRQVTEIRDLNTLVRDPELPESLQDLANEISLDAREACSGFDNPDVWYPGVDKGIEPLPDSHVLLVIGALQRELERERRNIHGQNMEPKLPAAQLSKLPWRIQRALAERRRLRYAQWGIGRAQWESGLWSLWDIPEDAEWAPRPSPVKSAVPVDSMDMYFGD